MTKTNYALLVIDVQVDYCSPKGVFFREGIDLSEVEKSIPKINNVIKRIKKTNIPIIFIKTERGRENSLDNIWSLYKSKNQTDLCLPESFGADFYEVDKSLADKIFVKHRYNPFTNEELEKYLKERSINTLILVGAFSDVCVDSAARAGFEKGFYIVALKDCLSSLGDKERDMEFYKKYYGAEILESNSFLKKLSK